MYMKKDAGSFVEEIEAIKKIQQDDLLIEDYEEVSQDYLDENLETNREEITLQERKENKTNSSRKKKKNFKRHNT